MTGDSVSVMSELAERLGHGADTKLVILSADGLGLSHAVNAATYEANAKKELERLDALTRDVEAIIEPVKDRPFIVFHDAYQYFENRFGLHAAGSVTISPDHAPGAERIAAIRHKISDLGATCVFSEPQFESRLIATVTEASATRVGILDPLGAGLAAGPDLYFGLIENMARSFADCLSGQS